MRLSSILLIGLFQILLVSCVTFSGSMDMSNAKKGKGTIIWELKDEKNNTVESGKNVNFEWIPRFMFAFDVIVLKKDQNKNVELALVAIGHNQDVTCTLSSNAVFATYYKGKSYPDDNTAGEKIFIKSTKKEEKILSFDFGKIYLNSNPTLGCMVKRIIVDENRKIDLKMGEYNLQILGGTDIEWER